ncbi:MAG: hypothetical protein KAH56_08385 [Candidatus Krumholzibacteria bacterium]|nr:hypothetical protein [Candidatus Krumholzibacteria bacterium]
MKIPDINIKCPAGPNARRGSRAMAHRRRLLKGKVSLGIISTFGLGLLLAGSIFISNKTTRMRADISDLDSRREALSARSGELLSQWNAATTAKVIIHRGKTELGLEEQEHPGLVLICKDDAVQDGRDAGWRRFFKRFGGGEAALAAGDQMSQVVGSMISLTPRDAQAAVTQGGHVND